MKKVLLVFISILTFSFLLVNNNTYAQEREYPNYIMLVPYQTYLHEQDNANTYQFQVYYYVYNVHIESINADEYFLISDTDINFIKGINTNTNSYELVFLNRPQGATFTTIGIRITVVKSIAETRYNYNPYNPYEEDTIDVLFSRDTALYILYQSDTGSIEYNSGYNDGYNEAKDIYYDYGYDIGYDIGYDDGYITGIKETEEVAYNEGYNRGKQDGYEEGRKSTLTRFIDNFHVWFIPAVIIVFTIGVFVSYKKGRDE